MRLSLGDRRTPCLNLTLDHKTAGIRLDNAPLTHFCWRPSLGVTWYGSETLPSFNRSDPFEPDPVDTGVGKGTDRSLIVSPSIAQGRISNIQKLRSNMKHTLSALALLSIATTPLFAEEDVVSAIPELPATIVTGELWESELQKTTASVTVLDRSALG